MSNIIDSIRMSGTTYAISDSGGTKVVEITQSDYDNLPTSAKTANIMYVITDAEPFDVSNYYTKDETSGATELATAFAATQPKLSAGTNITIDANNVISASGGSITIDPSLDSGSTNPVANSAITIALNAKSDKGNFNDFIFTSINGNTGAKFKKDNGGSKTLWLSKINGTSVFEISDIHQATNFSLVETSAITTSVTSSSTDTQIPSAKAVYDALGSGGIDSGTVQTMIDQSISGKTNQTDFVSHSGNTTMHVTASEKSTWNAKSDFSGNYNDLSNKPTIPTSASQLTNDSGYITSSALNGYATEAYVTAATNDMATKTWVGQQGYLTQHQDISGKQDVSGMTAYTTTATTNTLSGTVTAHTADTTIHVTAQDKTNWNNKSDFSGSYNDLTNKLSAGTNITIVDNVISAEGGGKAVAAGTNISITTGATADTINCTLNISNGTGGLSIKSNGASSASANHTAAFGQNTKATSVCAFAEGWGTTASGGKSHSEGDQTVAGGGQSHAEGSSTKAMADHSHSEGYASSATSRVTTMVGITTPYGWNTRHSEGYATVADNGCTHTEGLSTKALNVAEHSSGAYNVSYTASTTWGDSGNTLFSVGNGTADNARHNAFEIRQNGDIYISLNGQDVKLQDQLGGGGSSYSAGTGIDITNDVISVSGVVMSSAITTNITSSSTDVQVPSAKAVNDKLGGLSIVKLSQSEYDSLATKDNSTLYVIVN